MHSLSAGAFNHSAIGTKLQNLQTYLVFIVNPLDASNQIVSFAADMCCSSVKRGELKKKLAYFDTVPLASHVFSSNWRGINDFFFLRVCVCVARRTWSFSPKGHDHIYNFFTYPLETKSGITRGCRYFVKRLPKLKLSSICITIRQFNFLTYFDAFFFYLIDKKSWLLVLYRSQCVDCW